MPFTIKLIALTTGQATPHDGRYVVTYHPGPEGLPPHECLLYTTPDKHVAKQYPTMADAHAEWVRPDPREPVSPDGHPNRPLTAYSVLFEDTSTQEMSRG